MDDFESTLDWSDILGPVKYAIKVYKNKERINNFLTKLLKNYWSPNIVITGIGSAGKTILSQRLSGNLQQINWKIPKQSKFVERSTVNLNGNVKIVHTIPGQGSENQSTGIYNSIIENSNLEGLVFVVNYGFSQLRSTSMQLFFTEDRNLSLEDFKLQNKKSERESFIQLLEAIKMHLIKFNDKKIWLTIAVNKVDLYYDEIKEAGQFYHPQVENDFSNLIDLHLNDYKDRVIINASPLTCFAETFTFGEESVKPTLDAKEQQTIFSYFYNLLCEQDTNLHKKR